MARTTPTAVQALLDPGGEYDGTTDLSTFVAEASLIVDDLVAYASRKRLTLTDAKLAAIEARLGAHGYQQSDKGYASESEGGSSASYLGRTDKGLESTYHGQQAITLDTSGYLRSLIKGGRASATWLGKRPSEQINLADRG